MNHLNPMIEFKQSSVEGTLTVTLNNYDNPYEYGDISKEYIDLIPVASRGGLTPTSPMIDTAFTIDKNKKHWILWATLMAWHPFWKGCI